MLSPWYLSVIYESVDNRCFCLSGQPRLANHLTYLLGLPGKLWNRNMLSPPCHVQKEPCRKSRFANSCLCNQREHKNLWAVEFTGLNWWKVTWKEKEPLNIPEWMGVTMLQKVSTNPLSCCAVMTALVPSPTKGEFTQSLSFHSPGWTTLNLPWARESYH